MGTREVTRPWQAMCVDIMGKYPKSNEGYKYIIIFEDVFSRFIISAPFRSEHGFRVKRALEELICATFGTPEKIICDNGSEFKCDEVVQFLKESNIELEQTPVTSTQCNPTE